VQQRIGPCCECDFVVQIRCFAAFGASGFVFREEPEADGNLRAGEELAGEGDGGGRLGGGSGRFRAGHTILGVSAGRNGTSSESSFGL